MNINALSITTNGQIKHKKIILQDTEILCNLLTNLKHLPSADIDAYKYEKVKTKYLPYGDEKNNKLSELYATYIDNTKEGVLVEMFVKLLCLMDEESVDIDLLKNEFLRFKQHGKKHHPKDK